MAKVTSRYLMHARTHRKNCDCYKSDLPRDPKCEKDWPAMCPWWGMQLHRQHTGDFSNPEWWSRQINHLGTDRYKG